MPKVSVIVPVYNVEKYLTKCLDSILSQSFADFELILVDDESSDGCGTICDEYAEKDERVQVIHKKNAGVSAARNTGLDVSSGEYIAFCDSDDSWQNLFLEKMVNTAEREQLDVVSCTYQQVLDGIVQWKLRVPPVRYDLLNVQTRMQYIHQILLHGNEGWEIWTRLFRGSIIREQNIRFCTTCNNFAEDMGFVLQYMLYAKTLRVIDECLYNYTIRDGSMMRNSQDVIRLNEMNELSCFLGMRYCVNTLGYDWKKFRAITHYMVLYNQLSKSVNQENLSELPLLLEGIKNKKWFQINIFGLFGAYRLLKSYIGKRDAQRVLLLASFCLHKNWGIYRMTRGLFNRLYGYR